MKLLPLVLATAVTAVGMTTAQAASTHIDKIKSTGEVTLGFRESSIPFSYLDDNQKPIGYSMDICHNIVAEIGRASCSERVCQSVQSQVVAVSLKKKKKKKKTKN